MARTFALALLAGAADLAVKAVAEEAEAAFWKLGIKLVVAEDNHWDALNHFYLVMKNAVDNSCKWTHAFPLRDGEDLPKLGFESPDQLRDLNKCGPFVCSFYAAAVLEQNPAAELAFRKKAGGSYLGYLIGHHWMPRCPDIVLQDKDEYFPVENPLKALHASPSFVNEWLHRRLSEQGFQQPETGRGELVGLALEAMPDICTGSVRDVWDALWPGDSTARSMIIIGCATLQDEPTQPLLDKGAGGLFIDRDRKFIRSAIHGRSAPNRLILNATVRPADVGDLLKRHHRFTESTDVLQVDIDTFDGPMVKALLEVTEPLAVVVEVRDFLPMPFRYACLAADTKGMAWGGANLAYWMQELRQRNFHLVRLDGQDAVFFHGSVAKPHTRDIFMGAMACYFAKFALEFQPPMILGSPQFDKTILYRHYWMEADPHDVVDEVWLNLTTWRSDIRFSLEL